DAHARTRLPGRESELLPAATTVELVAEHAEGLVCLSGCARNGLGVVDPNAAAAFARAFDGALYVEFQRPYECGDARRNGALGDRPPDFSDGPDPADAQLRQICDRAFADRYGDANGRKRRARYRLEDELALIARLGLAGFFLLHWEVLELARECALEVRGPGSPRHALPPGRGRGSSVGSIVCYLTGLSHVDPVEAGLSLGRFINDEMVAVPDIDLDFPRDI